MEIDLLTCSRFIQNTFSTSRLRYLKSKLSADEDYVMELKPPQSWYKKTELGLFELKIINHMGNEVWWQSSNCTPYCV